jgi:tetratricopeptide (TPR) repeat protein
VDTRDLGPRLDSLRARLLDFGLPQRKSGGTVLSREGKKDQQQRLLSPQPGRREFLVRCGQSAAAAFVPPRWFDSILPPNFSRQAAVNPESNFHLHPRYRAKLPLESLLVKVEPGHDQFVLEKFAAQIEAVLAKWSAGLRGSARHIDSIESALGADFVGASFEPVQTKTLRSERGLQIQQNKFAERDDLHRDAFLQTWQSSFAPYNEFLTAEFQITGIDESPTATVPVGPANSILRTRIRYELVGSGRDFYREQRIGEWDLEWGKSGDSFRVRRWLTLQESRARSVAPVFVDISTQAFTGVSSYAMQLLHGADYWRTVLDQASGIDIYGHNGVAVGDFDGDGFDDLYVCQPAGLPNRLYRNRGDGTFEDVTESTGLGILENTACALFADFGNSGRQDLVVVRTDGPVLYVNEGNGKFRQHPDAFRFAKPPQGTFTGAAVADYDRDGWVDIYFCLYLYYQGADQYKYPLPYFDANNGPPNFLMRNRRDGTFRDVTEESGLNRNNTRYSFCCAWNDYDHDGWPDLYVVNDFGRKNLYHNNGDGTFTDVAEQAGVTDVGAGMSVCWLDYDNDTNDDLYVANMWTAAGQRITAQSAFQKEAPAEVRNLYRKHSMGNSLFRGSQTGKANFQEAVQASVGMGRWSWSSDAWDFDHDGFTDLYVTNGMVSGPVRSDLNSFFWRQVVASSPSDATPAQPYEQAWNALNDLLRSDGTWSGHERNVLYMNNRDGTFSDVSAVMGMDFLEDGRAFALSDFDHDGRLELLLKNRNGPQIRLLKNGSKELPPALSFRLRGTKSNRDAIGAVVTVTANGSRQTKTLQAGSGFLSQHTKELFFGLGDAKGPIQASVRWPSGLVQQFDGFPPNHRVVIEEGKEPQSEPFVAHRSAPTGPAAAATIPKAETLPEAVETWLLVPVPAPDFTLSDLAGGAITLSALREKKALLQFWTTESEECVKGLQNLGSHTTRWKQLGLQLLTVNTDGPDDSAVRALAKKETLSFPVLRATDDVAGTYNVLYRYLFDRHRDLPLPTAFLIDERGDIVKIYQGALQAGRIERDIANIPRTAAERLAKALPFPGLTDATEFQRNYLALGSVFFQREYFGQSRTFFELALRDDALSAEALYGLGSVYLKQSKQAEARDYFERAVKARASFPETLPNAWNNLGLLETQQGRTDEAIPLFEQALKLSPNNLIALDNLASAYRQQKRWDEARRVLEHALSVSPDNPEANYSLGMVYAQTGDNEHAYEFLQHALRASPDYPEALNNLGVLYLHMARRDDAVKMFEECMRVAPEFDQAYLNLARVYALEGDRDKAREVLRALLSRHPDHAVAKKVLADLAE